MRVDSGPWDDSGGCPVTTPDEFFSDKALAKQLYEAVRQAIASLGEAGIRVGKSQIAFRRRIAFAWVWMPGQYLTGRPTAPLVLSVGLRRRAESPRWKQVVESAPGRFTHHLELYAVPDVDAEVRAWLREAWEAAE